MTTFVWELSWTYSSIWDILVTNSGCSSWMRSLSKNTMKSTTSSLGSTLASINTDSISKSLVTTLPYKRTKSYTTSPSYIVTPSKSSGNTSSTIFTISRSAEYSLGPYTVIKSMNSISGNLFTTGLISTLNNNWQPNSSQNSSLSQNLQLIRYSLMMASYVRDLYSKS